MAGKTTYNRANRISDIQLQTSAYGIPVPKGWGTFRVPANLIWYGDFKSIAHTTKQSSGGKGAGSAKSVDYTYEAAIMMAVCQGQISSIRTIYRGQSIFNADPLSQTGLSLATGANGQAPWGYLTTNHPTEALGYSQTAYVYASSYQLTTQATIDNHGFEVVAGNAVSGRDDANPQIIIQQALGMVPLWKSAYTSDMAFYSQYCMAANLLLSPVLTERRQATSFLNEILQATNSEAVWSDGLLKIIPYGDTAVTGNGTTYTPNLTPVYDLTDDDFIPQDGETVLVSIKRPTDSYNYLPVEFLDRARNYATNSVPGVDKASIEQFGEKRGSSVSLKCICDMDIATHVAQLLVQRTCYVRKNYKFRLPWNYCLLEPMDLVTLTTGDLQRKLVRVTVVDEDEEGQLSFEAEEMLVGTAASPLITRQSPLGGGNEFDVDPGDTAPPLMVSPPRNLTDGALEVWCALAGGVNWGGADVWCSTDNSHYKRVGTQNGSARYGVVTAADPLEDHTDPDTTSSLTVDLTVCLGVLDPGTTADADKLNTLLLVGDELIAYSAATLVAPYKYRLDTYLRRAQLGTSHGAHTAGTEVMRMDDEVFKIPYREDQVGTTIYVKFQSFNSFGRAYQNLEDVDTYAVVLTPSSAKFTLLHWTEIEGKPPVVVDLNPDGSIKPGYIDTGGGKKLDTWRVEIDASTADLISDTNDLFSDLHDEIARALADENTIRVSVASLTVTVNGNTASINSEIINRTNADSALAGSITSLTATVNGHTAAITNEQIARANGDSSLAGSITSLTTTVNGNTTAISNETAARTTADSGLAASISSLSTTVGSHTASISTLAAATATTDGKVNAVVGLTLTAGNKVGGIRFANNGSTTVLDFDADYVTISGNLIVGGSIITGKLATNAITNVSTYDNNSPSSFTSGSSVTHATFSVTSQGGKHSVSLYCEIGSATSSPTGVGITVNCDGSPVFAVSKWCPGSWGGEGIGFLFNHTPGAGSHTYSVVYDGAPGAGAGSINNTNAVVMELKR